MGYMAAKGGFEAIQAAEELVQRKRVECNSSWLEIDQIIERLQYSVDRVMAVSYTHLTLPTSDLV